MGGGGESPPPMKNFSVNLAPPSAPPQPKPWPRPWYLVLVSKSKFIIRLSVGPTDLTSRCGRLLTKSKRSLSAQFSPLSAPFPLRNSRSAHAQSFSVTSVHRSVPAQPISARSVFRSAHMLWSSVTHANLCLHHLHVYGIYTYVWHLMWSIYWFQWARNFFM